MTLRVRMKNSMYDRRDAYAYHIPEYNEYEGEIIESPSWVSSDSFCLSTGDPAWPYRILLKDDIICGWEIKSKPSYNVFSINKNVITKAKNGWSCTCEGFKYRRHCRHIEEAKAA